MEREGLRVPESSSIALPALSLVANDEDIIKGTEGGDLIGLENRFESRKLKCPPNWCLW